MRQLAVASQPETEEASRPRRNAPWCRSSLESIASAAAEEPPKAEQVQDALAKGPAPGASNVVLRMAPVRLRHFDWIVHLARSHGDDALAVHELQDAVYRLFQRWVLPSPRRGVAGGLVR